MVGCMEMSAEYMAETAKAFGENGYEVVETPVVYDEGRETHAVRYKMTNGEIHIELECLSRPDRPDAYYMVIETYHGLHIAEYELDSWKHRPTGVEFKFSVAKGNTNSPTVTVPFQPAE